MDRRPLLHLLVWVYCLSWAFDFRATEEGGQPIQFAFFGLSLLSGTLVALLSWRRILVKPTGLLILIWGGYLLMTVAVAVVQRVPLNYFVRNSSVPLLLFLSIIVTVSAASWGFPVKTIVGPMLIAGVINIFWKMHYALNVAGLPLETVRVELLSPCQPFLIAFTCAALALRSRIPWGPVLIGAVGVSSYLLSVTRSAIIIIAAAAFASWIAARRCGRMGLLPPGFARRKLTHLAFAAGAVVIAAGIVGVVSPTVYERWYQRLAGSEMEEQTSMDPSTMTRLAENKAFLDMMNDDPLSWIWGKGVGQPYYWDESFAPELAWRIYGSEDEYRSYTAHIWFPGHSLWTYAVFSSGIAGLLCHIAVFGLGIATALRSGRLAARVRSFPPETAFLPFIGLLAYLSQSLTFNPFQERVGGIVLGVLLGLPQFLHTAAWRESVTRRTSAVNPGTAPVPGLAGAA